MLTTPILTTVQAWIQADGIDWNSYRTVMRAWVSAAYDPNGGRNPIHALERGECSGGEFEQILAAQLFRLDGGAVAAEGLLQRMFAASARDSAMYEMIRALRGAGLRTALLSNSWGCDEYPRADFPGLFDTVVISGECGMRKPEEEIFLHTVKILGLEPEQCVFIDDMEANVAAAVACGMTHRDGADGGGATGPARRRARPAGADPRSPRGPTDPADPTNPTDPGDRRLVASRLATRCDNRRARRLRPD